MFKYRCNKKFICNNKKLIIANKVYKQPNKTMSDYSFMKSGFNMTKESDTAEMQKECCYNGSDIYERRF
tara:strand:+ start:4428 stop:4634 length:207 start_codon:yes stop_codon:yes gene_type:complete